MASEYASSPVLQPATQIFNDGYVRKMGTTCWRIAAKEAGSRNMSLTWTVRYSSSAGKAAGSRRTRSCSCESVSHPKRLSARPSRRFSESAA